MKGLARVRHYLPGFGLKKEKEIKMSGWVSGNGVMGNNECQFYGQSGKTRAKQASRCLLRTSSDG